jgi:ketosteroid isomerase-like protein
MSQENVELLRRINEAFNRADFDPMFALAHPPPEFEYVHDPAFGPDLGGVQRGREGFRRVVEGFWDEFDDAHIELHELIDAGDQVFISASFRGRGKAERRGDELGTALVRMDRGGRQGGSLAGLHGPGRRPRSRRVAGVGDVAGERRAVSAFIEAFNSGDLEGAIALADPPTRVRVGALRGLPPLTSRTCSGG